MSASRRAGAGRHRDAVAGRLHGIGRVAIEPADAAGREHDRVGGKRDARVAGRGPPVHAVGALAVDDQIGRRDVFDDLDRRVRGDRVDERAQNRVSGRVAAGFDDAAALVRGFASQRQLAVGVAIERGPEFQQFFDPRGRVLGEDGDDFLVADAGAGALRVDRMQSRRVVFTHGGGDAALGPVGRGAFAQTRLAQDGDLHRHELEGGHQPGNPGADDEGVAAMLFDRHG